ncbi:MAG: sulfotransferase domain-containing protein [Bryobacteraceae bacterium]
MPKPIAAYFSHHKCATDWALRVLTQLSRAVGFTVHHTHWPMRLPLDFEKKPPWDARIAEAWDFAANGDFDLLIATNAEIDHVRTLSQRGFKGFHVIRDPRDVIVSGYFSHLASHYIDPDQNPWLGVHRERLQTRSKEEGLLAELDYSSTHMDRIRYWEYGYEGTLESRFEDVMPNPDVEFARLLAFTGIVVDGYTAPDDAPVSIRISREIWDSVMEANSFRNLTAGREKGEESPSHHLRSGLAGDWRNHFTPAVTERFKRLYPGMAVALGYEKDDFWQ